MKSSIKSSKALRGKKTLFTNSKNGMVCVVGGMKNSPLQVDFGSFFLTHLLVFVVYAFRT